MALVLPMGGAVLCNRRCMCPQRQFGGHGVEVRGGNALRENAEKSSLIRAAFELLIPMKTKSSL